MPHKLVISYQYTGKLERDENIEVRLLVQNIGETDFGGGLVTNIHLELPRINNIVTKQLALGPISKGQSISMEESFSLSPHDEGVGWLVAKITASDGQPVEHYQKLKSDTYLMGDEWKSPMFIENPRTIEMISLLKDIANLLRKKV